MNNDDNIRYAVFGLRSVPSPDGPEADLEILGVFGSAEDAMVFKSLHDDMDTTLDGTSIATVNLMERVPEMEVMLSVEVDVPNNRVIVKSQLAPLETESWLRDEERYFQALAWPEDKEHIVKYASAWLKNRTHRTPEVREDVPASTEDIGLSL